MQEGGQGVWRIALIESHKVKTGESIESLATQAGMTWQQLARFNWDTDVPDKINEHLRDDVGCTKKTPSGYNYVFDDTDDPGIVYIPRPWQADGLMTNLTHVVRVDPTPKPLWLRFTLESETTGHLLPYHPYKVYDSAQTLISDGKTDADAQGSARVPVEGEYLVVPGKGLTFAVSGTAYERRGRKPLADVDLSVEPWQEAARTAHTDKSGKFSLDGIPEGELVLKDQDAEYSLFVDRAIVNGEFVFPFESAGSPPGPDVGDV